ncbi:23S rRNA (adenine(2030)-N(6))-methyltransferase RlmJ [Acuticoccus sp. M5D2P5]|uniref:23S rRNA (adenine(2030)-N(6))-methyltransferase RlmJ n=1 Tax=Acuticoccus kalidii TaxID=2910977 RepID=UPI001F394035|nr:23S rRNA (adenine(2030)-N(6))-methyltransferase RlmJ [Acuticoccus kalidii]MCF3935812.1 23S rRNA (adenine(2030)-N(6))-methyltransferase RlmJ [Acuticoccus kalidii]
MNYRHIYHAGNFADILKHAILVRLITYLKRKDKAFRVIDTHAGIGLYDLSSDEAQKTGEWREGIGRLMEAPMGDEERALLAPYLDVVAGFNEGGRLERYPGSPLLVRALLRKQDRLSAIELHPDDYRELAGRFAGDHQVRVTMLDGWLALGGHLPPKERRGIILVDPPFEAPGEYERMVEGLGAAYRRFAGGIYALWYPLKMGAPIGRFHANLAALGIPRMLVAELSVTGGGAEAGLSGSGLVIVNPPYTLVDELEILLPRLCAILRQSEGASWRVNWLRGEE